MGSSGAIGVALLFFGTFIAFGFLKNDSQREAANIVPMPRIGGGALRRGPWPGCLGIGSEECVAMIETYATDCDVVVVTPTMAATKYFDTKRVLIYVDEDNIVTQIPIRGR